MNRANEWKKAAARALQAEAVELRLPSGAVILARRPNPDQLAAWSRLPLLLTSAVGSGGAEAAVGRAGEALEIMREMRDLLVYCCVSPRVTTEAREGEDEIHPRDIPREDWTFILRWALRTEEAEALRPFRAERGDAGGSGDGVGVRAEAVGADGN